ncbi:hypothetical protein FBD94_16730 [Pedobacter hiemivivus]|uniref:ATP-binding protein n=1 Tax=Pedobacter hiemivivus TaxID=2530454 RepID=A0A4V5PD33_9SPHI|nr:hypothetical protein [Pedobacter hiemivivus]TKC59176.1 hypothetical protein FBD94_16730 [Pedobacter hiemivivus]
MIEIKSSINIQQINHLYRELADLSGKQIQIDLKLPKAIQKRNFGVVFSLLQFICTWIRNEDSGALILPVSTDAEAIDYLTNEFVYPSVVLSWEKQIRNINGENIRSFLKAPSQEYYRKLDFFENKERDSIPVFCFDHDLSKRGKSRVFYDAENQLLSEAYLDFTLHPALVKLSNHFNKRVFKSAVKNELNSIYGIISELFTNTHEHARTNEKGFNLYPNLRSLYIKFHKAPVQTYLQTYKELPGLVKFFNSEFKVNDQNELYLIELSFLDSGPGYVKRFTGRSDIIMPIEQEVEIIKQCLSIHKTSAPESNKSIKGYGLDRMLELLNGKGFLRIKTGHADVFRDMKNVAHIKDIKKSSDIVLYDWSTNSDDNFTVNQWSEGALISIFYPLDFLPYD